MARARGFDALGQDGEQRGIEAGAVAKLRKGERDLARAGRGFEQHSIARDQCMQRMNRGQEERIVSRADHEHDTEAAGAALQTKRRAAKTDGHACRSAAARARGAALRSSQRHASASGRTSETSFSASGRSLTAAGGNGEARPHFPR